MLTLFEMWNRVKYDKIVWKIIGFSSEINYLATFLTIFRNTLYNINLLFERPLLVFVNKSKEKQEKNRCNEKINQVAVEEVTGDKVDLIPKILKSTSNVCHISLYTRWGDSRWFLECLVN